MTKSSTSLAQLYTAERGLLQRVIRRIVGGREDADDLAQDVFVRLSERGIKPEGRGILLRTARNLAIDRYRAQRLRTGLADEISLSRSATDCVTPEAAVAARQELSDLLDALRTLPRRRQQIFLLNRVDGMSHPQIARAMDVSVSTVEKEIHQALEFCRRWQKERDLF